jgi:hypothetical protein
MSDVKISTGLPQPQGIGEDPLLAYTKIFVRFLQVVFATFEKGSYRWENDLELTDIVIADQGMLGNPVVEKRPSIICMRGPASWSNIAIDQFKSFEFETGARHHTDLISATMTYNCLAKEGLEAQRLAWIAAYATRVLKRSLMKAGLHRVGENIEMGAETDAGNLLPDSGKDVVLVQVAVPFFFQDTWRVAPVDNLLLKDLSLGLTSQLTSPTEVGTSTLNPPSIGGQVLKIEKTVSLTTRVSQSLTQKKK